MLRHRLRIAWSVFFAVLTVALCVLWVRSDYQGTILSLETPDGNHFGIASIAGHVLLGRPHAEHQSNSRVEVRSLPINSWSLDSPLTSQQVRNLSGMELGRKERGLLLSIPHWALLLVCAECAILIWLPVRFSLRTMVILITLVAMVLGLVVWSVRG
jgi:hypothetical protein